MMISTKSNLVSLKLDYLMSTLKHGHLLRLPWHTRVASVPLPFMYRFFNALIRSFPAAIVTLCNNSEDGVPNYQIMVLQLCNTKIKIFSGNNSLFLKHWQASTLALEFVLSTYKRHFCRIARKNAHENSFKEWPRIYQRSTKCFISFSLGV